MPVPNTFANATATIPLSQLDANFATTITLGNTAIQLGNTVSTLNDMTLANVTVTSGNVTITNVSVTTANVTTANITTAIIGTANVTTANVTTGIIGTANVTTGNITTAVITTANVATANITTSQILNYGTANSVVYLNSSKAATANTALQFDGTNLGLGVTPSAWSSGKAQEIGNAGSALWGAGAGNIWMFSNIYYNSNYIYASTGNYGSAYQQVSGQHRWWNTAIAGTAGGTASLTQAMTLDASGNLGIGTTSPAQSWTGGSARVAQLQGGSSQITVLRVNESSGTYGDLQLVSGASAEVGIYNFANGAMRFGTNGTERARITSGGDFYVGDTNNTLGNTRLYIKGDGTNPASRIWANTSTTSVYGLVVRHESTTAGAYIQFVTDSNVETGRIYDLAGTMQYASSSDARLKTNVQPMQNSLQSVLALNPCTFDMRRGEDTFIPSAGLIAQEVHEVYPFVVGVGGDDENTNPWSVDYGKLTPLLVAAIKELNAKVEAQAAEIAALKAQP